jgi:hypothetical protein
MRQALDAVRLPGMCEPVAIGAIVNKPQTGSSMFGFNRVIVYLYFRLPRFGNDR